MNKLQELRALGNIPTVAQLNPINKERFLNIPSQMDLLLLGTNLLYKAKLILDDEIQAPRGKTAMMYTYEAQKLLKIVDNYRDEHLTHKEVNAIRKEYKLFKTTI